MLGSMGGGGGGCGGGGMSVSASSEAKQGDSTGGTTGSVSYGAQSSGINPTYLIIGAVAVLLAWILFGRKK